MIPLLVGTTSGMDTSLALGRCRDSIRVCRMRLIPPQQAQIMTGLGVGVIAGRWTRNRICNKVICRLQLG